ncbi:MAG: chromosomal replication initiator protein DnaA [Chlamydiae bacterium]|nr:chromosomal replication initiator protein DnaA [Chlamydiota bacterium]
MEQWENFLKKQEKDLGKATVDKWLRSLKIINYDAANLYLEAIEPFQLLWFEEHIRPKILISFINDNERPIQIHLSLQNAIKEKKKNKIPPFYPIAFEADKIDPKMNFENFICSEKNQFIFQFFLNFTPGIYNPIFLHGPQGIGKTHLLMAFANLLKAKGHKVFYVHAETFTEHLVKAIRAFQMEQFRKIYRQNQTLIIDDVHLFARRNATQEEFFNTFNALHQAGQQIILSSHFPPFRLNEIEPRLISRFEWGILFHLQKLQLEEQRALLKSKADYFGIHFGIETIDYLIKTFSSSTRSLLRALDAFILRTQQLRLKKEKKITLLEMKEILHDLIQEEKQDALSPEKIIHFTSQYFGITTQDILGKSQTQESSHPRQLAMYFCRELLNLSYLKIGHFFSRDHSTVMTSIKQVQEKIENRDSAILTSIEEISNKLEA